MKDLVQQTIVETIEKGNWDFYRENYLEVNYSFSDLKYLNNEWRKHIVDQVFFHKEWVKAFFKTAEVEAVTVWELGCWEGNMAEVVLSEFPFLMWQGFDICSDAAKKANRKGLGGFVAVSLPFQIWNLRNDRFDVFVSAHTIEHLAKEEAIYLLEWLNKSKAKYIYLELPIPEKGKIWKGGASAHVLNGLGRKHIRNFFRKRGWSIFFQNSQGMDWAIGVER